jgi:hypothetical protein
MTDLAPAPDRIRLFIANGKSPSRARRRRMPGNPREVMVVEAAPLEQVTGAH